MGFFDKVKNMFTEEVEDDDVKVEQIKKEVTHVSIESPNAKKDDDNEFESDIISFKMPKEEEKSKPVFFDDNDFNDLNFAQNMEKKTEPIEKRKEIYGIKHAVEKPTEEKKIFKPTPIISPVYGVLDKNYHKEDIVSRKVESKNIDQNGEPSIDSIRNKAYGTLEDELENTLFGSNSILFKRDESKEEEQVTEVDSDVLSDLTDDISKELDELLIKKEKYSDQEKKSSKNEDTNIDDEDLLGFIDSTLYKKGEDE